MKNNNKGGPGSGPQSGNGGSSRRPLNPDKPAKPRSNKPSNYTEKPSVHNPDRNRSGISPHDLFPERYNPDGTLKR